jgi:phosphoenolpyruvate carboxylase
LINFYRLDSKDLTPFERKDILEGLEREVAGSWLTDEIRRRKPTPDEEAMGGFAVLEQNLCIKKNFSVTMFL